MNDEPPPPEKWVGTANGRGPNGLFAKGNRLATGNPLAKLHYQYRKRFAEASTPEEQDKARAALVEVVLDKDHPGFIAAQRLYSEMNGGRQTLSVELGGEDGEAIKVEATHAIAVILAALSKHPEVKIEVAAALRANRLGQQGGGDAPGDPA